MTICERGLISSDKTSLMGMGPVLSVTNATSIYTRQRVLLHRASLSYNPVYIVCGSRVAVKVQGPAGSVHCGVHSTSHNGPHYLCAFSPHGREKLKPLSDVTLTCFLILRQLFF